MNVSGLVPIQVACTMATYRMRVVDASRLNRFIFQLGTRMFETTPLNPPDAIFGLIEQFKQDSRPEKINLSVGVYQDEHGNTPTLGCVRDAEKLIFERDESKSYLPIDGIPDYNGLIGNLVLGDELCPVGAHPVRSTSIHSVTVQTLGGTTALRVAGDFLRRVMERKRIWISNPTWANHQQIFSASGLELKKYNYLDESNTALDFESVLGSLAEALPGDAILLHAVCHNPTGVDFDKSQWQQLGDLIRDKSLIPVFDFAYQGFGIGVEEDAWPIRNFCSPGAEAFICNSFSKNFGLYGERVGGLTVVSGETTTAGAVLSQLKKIIRTTYSNPPIHGASIVKTVLSDPTLRNQWVAELATMRDRIKVLRSNFVEIVNGITPEKDFEYITRQRGMFSYSGLNKFQVDRLREEFAIYALGSGRINIAGLNGDNIERVCEAIAEVTRSNSML